MRADCRINSGRLKPLHGYFMVQDNRAKVSDSAGIDALMPVRRGFLISRTGVFTPEVDALKSLGETAAFQTAFLMERNNVKENSA